MDHAIVSIPSSCLCQGGKSHGEYATNGRGHGTIHASVEETQESEEEESDEEEESGYYATDTYSSGTYDDDKEYNEDNSSNVSPSVAMATNDGGAANSFS